MTNYPEEFVHAFVELCLSKRHNRRMHQLDACGFPTSFTQKKSIESISIEEQKYYSPIVRLLNDKSILPSLLVEITRHVSDDLCVHARRVASFCNNYL